MRKTKIVCTLGPSVDSPETMKNLMLAGMNVARFNFSHGDYQEQGKRIKIFKEAREELKLPIPMLLDTKGPEIRIGKFAKKIVELVEGNYFTLINEDILGDSTKVSINYKELYKDLSIGSKILINDGLIELEVIEFIDKDIKCKILNGGELSNTKSVNVPNLVLHLPSITEKDISDVKFGVEQNFDYIAASFVRKPEDILAIKDILEQNNGSHIKVIAKIENREGIDNFKEILKVADGIMVARGDLGVEIPIEEVPIVQKRFIKQTYRAGKPVITATQMLESMIKNPRPTRAEVSDIANAISDGSSAIMLSGETAMGNYPIECVKTMAKVASSIENSLSYWKRFERRDYNMDELSAEFIINHSICTTSMNLNAKAIFAFTQVGDTPKNLASFSPSCPIFAITQSEDIYKQMGLVWGVYPMLFTKANSIEELLQMGIDQAIKLSFISKGDTIIISGGPNAISSSDSSGLNRMLGGVLEI